MRSSLHDLMLQKIRSLHYTTSPNFCITDPKQAVFIFDAHVCNLFLAKDKILKQIEKDYFFNNQK